MPFAMVTCRACARKVLPWTDLTDDGSLVRRCLHCDAALEPTDRELALRLSWVEVQALGYEPVPPERVRSGVCGSDGDGGCGGACSSKRT